MKCVYKTMQSPVGQLKLVANDKGLVAILWEFDDPLRIKLDPMWEDQLHPVLIETERQLNEYFEGRRKSFSIPLDLIGTGFQKQVWNILLEIPFGKTRSYGEIAKQMGDIKTIRAVGGANGKNPVSIIVPCHRVIGATGKLTGFAGGLKNKAYLLALEAKEISPTLW